MLSLKQSLLLEHIVEAKMILMPAPFPNPIGGMAKWAKEISKSTIEYIDRFSDFMEWNDLLRNDLKERIRTGLYMDFHYKHPNGAGAVIPAEGALWALMMTEEIMKCIGLVMRLYSKFVE
jgi:hypothetical protein